MKGCGGKYARRCGKGACAPRVPAGPADTRGAMRETAARLRNLLDQKTGREKRTLRKYVITLERRLCAPAERDGGRK